MEMEIYPKEENTSTPYAFPINKVDAPTPLITNTKIDYQQKNNLDNFPHKGIFQPEPNILICKAPCGCKFIGLYIILFGSIFGIFFPIVGINTKIIVFIIAGTGVFSITIIVGIILFCTTTTEVKFTFSKPLVDITISTLCRQKKQIVQMDEIANIIFDYHEKGRKVHQELNIIFKNGTQYRYFNFNSSPPCYTKYEIEYFNNEVKRLLEK